MDMLKCVEVDVIRNMCAGHINCLDCGDCVICTYPHKCCCGKCSSACNHDHPAQDEACHYVNVILHP